MEQDNLNEDSKENKELNIRDIIRIIQEYFKELLRNWHLIAGCVAVMLVIFLYIHFSKPITFSTKVKFLVEGESGGGGGLASLARQFGFGGGATSGKTNPFKILEVGQSDFITKKVLLHPVNDTLIGNRIIEVYNLREVWKEQENGLENFYFQPVLDLDQVQSRKAFNKLKRLLWGSEDNPEAALLNLRYNDERGVFILRSETEAQILSVSLVNHLYQELRDFFELEILRNQLNTKKVLGQKVDSLAALRRQKNYDLAAFEDSNRGLFSQKSQVRRSILNQDIIAINIAYGEALKNLELADITLQDLQPLFLQIEGPIPPLKANRSSLIRFALIAIILGGFFSVTYILGRKIFLDALARADQNNNSEELT